MEQQTTITRPAQDLATKISEFANDIERLSQQVRSAGILSPIEAEDAKDLVEAISKLDRKIHELSRETMKLRKKFSGLEAGSKSLSAKLKQLISQIAQQGIEDFNQAISQLLESEEDRIIAAQKFAVQFDKGSQQMMLCMDILNPDSESSAREVPLEFQEEVQSLRKRSEQDFCSSN